MNATRESVSRASRLAKFSIVFYVLVIIGGIAHVVIGPELIDRAWGVGVVIVTVGAILAQLTIMNLCKKILLLTDRGAA